MHEFFLLFRQLKIMHKGVIDLSYDDPNIQRKPSGKTVLKYEIIEQLNIN